MPPCPDPDLYIAVKTKNGFIWRRRRGTVKPAKVNDVLAAFANNAKVSMPAAKRLLLKLRPFSAGFDMRGSVQRFASRFSKSIMVEGSMSWSFFAGLDINYTYPLRRRLHADYRVVIEKNTVSISIPVKDSMINKERNRDITAFFFELIMVSGDPADERSLRTESDTSAYYPVCNNKPATCRLCLQLPENKPYMVMLKWACIEGKLTAGPRYMGMKVVEVG